MSSRLIMILIIVVIFAVAVGALYYVIYRIRRKVREFSRAAFGTDSLSEGFAQTEQAYAETPKSVSAMTSLYVPKIKKDFPDFSYDEMKQKAQNAVVSYLHAITNRDVALLQEGNEECKNKVINILQDLSSREERETYQSIHIHRMECSNYQKRNGRCIITFQCSIEYIYYRKKKDGTLVAGDENMKKQARYETDLIYIQDRDLANQDTDGTIGLNCPNCDAPLTSLGAKTCPYCGTPIIELNIHAWSFSDIRAV